MTATAPRLVLASASATRARLLRDAGVPFDVVPAHVDEGALRDGLAREGAAAEDAATALAELKARHVAGRLAGPVLVLGCDQILDCEGAWLAKPGSVAAARDQLLRLRGREHRLVTAGVLLREGERVWHRVEAPRLWMRSFSDAFLDHYLDSAGAALTTCVGAYRLEGAGIQLFSRITGDYFAILGLPLLSLLEALREHGVLPR